MPFKRANRWRSLLLVPFLFFCGNKKERVSQLEKEIKSQFIPDTLSKKEFGKLYKWKENYDPANTILSRINPPEGYRRLVDTINEFGLWLQNLPLKKIGTAVKLYNGENKKNQGVHFAVVDIDCGTKDLQQCADAVMRLRAEYLYAKEKYSEIEFRYTSGDVIAFSKWSEGFRPLVKGNKVGWIKNQAASKDYNNFKNYLWNIFNYAGSKSLSGELASVKNFEGIKTGDVLIAGGFPGHAMTVIDVAINKKTGKKIFLLAQSYMPAQDIHIVKNYNAKNISPWYEIPDNNIIDTPEWTFKKENLMRWK